MSLLPPATFRDVKDVTADTAIAALLELGVIATPTVGACRGLRDLVTIEHDGVPYCMFFMGADGLLKPEGAKASMYRRQLLIERHHAVIKAVHQHCLTSTGGNVWAMCGGGSQLQVFFGNATGYLAILYLDLIDLEEHKRLSESGYLEAVGNRAFSLVVQATHNNELFSGLSNPCVSVRFSD